LHSIFELHSKKNEKIKAFRNTKPKEAE